MTLNAVVVESLFGPKELADITGLAMDAQRNWRIRGHLQPNKEHGNKLGTRAAAELAVRSWASKIGIAPRVSHDIGEIGGPSVLFWAFKLTTPKPVKIQGPPEKVRQYYSQLEQNSDELWSLVGLKEESAALSIVWREDEIPTLLFNQDDERQYAMEDICMRLINLQALGGYITDQIRRPLFEVTVS